MKNYRSAVMILLVVLMALSIFTIGSEAAKKKSEVDLLEQEADHCIEQQMPDKAAAYLEQLIDKNDRPEYYLKAAQMYLDAGRMAESEEWCLRAKNKFPKDPEAYEKLIEVLLIEESVDQAFEVLDEFKGRNLSSEKVDAMYEDMKYLWFDNLVLVDEVRMPSGGYFAFSKDSLWGLSTDLGKKKTQGIYSNLGYFANEMISVSDQNGQWFFMDKEGRFTHNISASISDTILSVGIYNEGLFPVQTDRGYYYCTLDMKAKQEIYDYAGSFNAGIAAVQAGGLWYLIKEDGSVIDSAGYEDILLDERGICCTKNRVFAKKQGEYQMLDNNGNRIGSDSFEDAVPFGTGEYTAVKKAGKWGFVDIDGKVVIQPFYDEAGPFACGLAPVKTGDTWGYIDVQGESRIPSIYSDAYAFTGRGSALAQSEGRWYLIKLYEYNH